MRTKIINFLKQHPRMLDMFWVCMRFAMQFIGFFIPIKKKRIIFASFGGRKYDDSPKAIYEEILTRTDFSDWDFVWAFVDPDQFDIPKGRKVKIDTPSFFISLLSSHVWISNSGMDRGIELNKRGIIKVETWHGCPLKKICGEENTGSLISQNKNQKTRKKDNLTIRCAQSEYDQTIFSRIFNADPSSIHLSDLPRNDELTKPFSREQEKLVKEKIGIPQDKKVLLYMPTYREYNIDSNNEVFMKPPMDLSKWKEKLGGEYVLLIRAHYAVAKVMNIQNDNFSFDVSAYPTLNELYLISDAIISDYSSSYFDYSILERPMFCFAYDYEEYEKKRGLYLKLEDCLPCPINTNEDELLDTIIYHFNDWAEDVIKFHQRFAAYAGNAASSIVDIIVERLGK